ncbi:hypothetical protein [Oleispirillum naphthae]|uniref:hypothetical protein n=1 Tax=Oleispirillum naphthae TaxID=2838853 RepID=UPI0030825211
MTPMHNLGRPKMPFAFRLPLALACAVALAAPAAAAEGGGAAKTAFGPGERELQLAPMWVPVAGLKPRRPGIPAYRPLTLVLTSEDGGMIAMCHKLPYLTEAFLFELFREDIPGKGGHMDTTGLGERLLAAASAAAGPGVVKAVQAVDGTPYPSKSNQDILALCQ